MKWLEHGILWVYAHLLKLYPAEFYTQFAEEMQDACRQRLQEERSQMLWTGLREIASLLFAISREWQQGQNPVRPLPQWQMLLILGLPVFAGGVILLFRSISIFYLPGKTWVVFAGISLMLLAMGWMSGHRLTVLALPTLGFMLSVGARIFDYQTVGIPLEIRYGVPFLAMVFTLMVYSSHLGKSFSLRRWLPYIVLLPLIALVVSLAVIIADNALAQQITIGQLYRGYVLGTFIMPGALALPLLIGIPFAARFGSSAVLFISGYLFSDLLGLSATLPYGLSQNIAGGTVLVLFLLIIPASNLGSSDQRPQQRSILGMVTFAYIVLLAANLVSANLAAREFGLEMETSWGFDAIFTLYRVNELLQTLLMIALAMAFYTQLKQHKKQDEIIPQDPKLSSSSYESQ